MTELVRARFAQHDDLATLLVGTGDGRILYDQSGSSFWGSGGQNWLGRILELVRSELVARPLTELLRRP